jgi:IS5 family transposase
MVDGFSALAASFFLSPQHRLRKRVNSTMLDATLIEASVKPVRGARSTPGQRSPHDADADWTKRGHQAFFGYKAHLAMDHGSELIRAAIMTSAKVLAARNRRLGRIRGAVERKFAVLKERYRCRRVRYRGLLKNQLHVADLLCDEPQARARAAGHRMSARPPQQCVCSSEIASTSVAAPPNRTLLTS